MFGRGGKGMGGGPGGANMLRAVGRAAVSRASTASFQEPLSSSTSSATRRHNNNNSNGHLYLPSSFNGGVPITANDWPAFSGPPCFDDFEWVSVDATEEENNKQPHDFVLGPVPCVAEVENALSALQRVVGVGSSRELIRDKFPYNVHEETGYHSPSSDIISVNRIRSTGSESEWIEPSMQLHDTQVYQNSVYDALHLMQTDSLIQKMVMSISSDEAIWNAVLNNEVVRELRKSYCAAAEDSSSSPSFDESSAENSNESSETTNINIVKWIFNSTKGKILEVFDKITKLFSGLFKLPPPSEEKGTADTFDAKLRISMVLSVLVLFIVGVARARTH
ncbi:uncharacterized protein LOC120135846 [Hibiscus syriacus]|uniref:uncharacterized protein LOC120135846 n=1 Tax=Hibiscus syriacus TaxID=106335 RepID=UPI0019229144|nr:uncharacterized protein LOC120135846 [Hibiscus syriacus]